MSKCPNVFGSSSSRWSNLLHSGRDSDVTIVTGDQKLIKVHKLVLGMKGIRLKTAKGRHYMKFNSEVVWRVLTFVYTENIELPSSEVAIEMYEVAKYFGGLFDLRNTIREAIRKGLNDETWVRVLLLSFKFDDVLLYDMCKKFYMDGRRGFKCFTGWQEILKHPMLMARLLDELSLENQFVSSAVPTPIAIEGFIHSTYYDISEHVKRSVPKVIEIKIESD